MNIKSLLLGSAAAMVAVSGSQAADAVVVEPEPVEYVRICDAYGSGFFYIPGTETCMKLSGYVRTAYTRSDNKTAFSGGKYKLQSDDDGDKDVNWNADGEETVNVASKPAAWNSRARFNVDSRSETEMGTLRSHMRFQASAATDDGAKSSLEIDQAYISLGGFRAGIAPSLFNTNYAVVGLEGAAGEDFDYGYTNAHVADYTFNAGDVSISFGVEDADGKDATDISMLGNIQLSTAGLGTIGYVGEMEDDKDYVHKVYGSLDLSDALPGGKIGGWYMAQNLDGGKKDGKFKSDQSTRAGAKSVWGAAFQMDLGDNMDLNILHARYTDVKPYETKTTSTLKTQETQAGVMTTSLSEKSATTIGLNWYPVDGLKVFGSYTFWDGKGTSTFTANKEFDAEGEVSNPARENGRNIATKLDNSMLILGLKRSF